MMKLVWLDVLKLLDSNSIEEATKEFAHADGVGSIVFDEVREEQVVDAILEVVKTIIGKTTETT